MVTTHTPGPWKLTAGRTMETASGTFSVSRGEWIGTPTELDANARLVAAAPELLEALRWIAGQNYTVPAADVVDRARLALRSAGQA